MWRATAAQARCKKAENKEQTEDRKWKQGSYSNDGAGSVDLGGRCRFDQAADYLAAPSPAAAVSAFQRFMRCAGC
jgi:hypothetical protein